MERDAAVGRLTYGSSGNVVDVDDRALAHIQIVIGAKLRRRESLFFSWREGSTTGGGRSSIWIDPSIELVFSYSSAERVDINRRWLESLVLSANSPQGLQLTEEPAEDEPLPAIIELTKEKSAS